MSRKPRSLLCWSISVGLIALFAFAPVRAAAQAGTLDQQQTDTSGGNITMGEVPFFGFNASFAQTFTAGLSGELDRVDLPLQGGGTDPLIVEIRDTSGGVPGGTVLASASVPASSVPDAGFEWVAVTFSGPATVQSGTQYAIVAYTTDTLPPGYSWFVGPVDTYAGGATWESPDVPPSSIWFGPTNDAAFKTYVVVAANNPPDCSGVSVSPDTLSPATRDQFKPVTLAGGSDPDGDPVTLTVTGVTQDEPLTARGDDTSPDAQAGATSNEVLLRAERNPMGDGRVYRISFTASDGEGGSCTGTVTVQVPRKKGETAVDSGGSFNSFGP
jgi:Bacterial Ig domain